MYEDKQSLLEAFRYYANQQLTEIVRHNKDYKKQGSAINSSIKNYKDLLLSRLDNTAQIEQWSNERKLNSILLLDYTMYVVMLEFRNKVWPYEYMAFARRIGELWEPFCKEPFYYPVKRLSIITPPEFDDVQANIKQNVSAYINSLNVDSATKRNLHYYYSIPWKMVDSGGIKLALDLHFNQNGINHNCDFKSGFSSNEKGNTNRLLLVASIYKFLDANEQMILFVRQPEEQNNHYLQTLKNSGYWDVYCAQDTYQAIYAYTGFNLRNWLDNNAIWEADIDDQLRKRLIDQNILNYLTW